MKPDDVERLRQFLGAYFHQDWDLDAPTMDGIIDRYVADHSRPLELTRMASLVEDFANRHGADSALRQALLDELFCSYSPEGDGVGAAEWLRHVAQRLRGAADHLGAPE